LQYYSNKLKASSNHNFKFERDLVMKKSFILAATFVGAVALAGCDNRSQDEIWEKTKSLSNPADIALAIGEPDKIVDDGALKMWLYNASGGNLCFSVVGDMAIRTSCWGVD
jgi:hypothetical protein